MKYFSIALLVILVVVLAVGLFSGRSAVGDPGAPADGQEGDIQGDGTEDLEKRLTDRKMALMGYVDPEDGENYTFVQTPETCPFLKEGELAYTVTGARVITNINDLPDGTLFDDTAEATGEDGSFLSGVYMVMLDISFENRGAANYVSGEESKIVALYSDPYLFWIKNYLYLQDVGNDVVSANAAEIGPTFYSDFGKYSATGSGLTNEAVRVEPGETRQITLGYTVTERDGHMPEPEDLYAWSLYEEADESGSVNCSVYLGLDGEGDR